MHPLVHPLVLLLGLFILAPPTMAASGSPTLQRALYFVCDATQTTADGGAVAGTPTALGTLWGTNVARVVPALGGSAVKIVSTPAFNCWVGDVDGDGDLFEAHGDDIDALGWRRHGVPGPVASPGTCDFVFSTSQAWGGADPTAVLNHTGALDGSLVSVRRKGLGAHLSVDLFLSERMVLDALGQIGGPPESDVDVDAFVQDEAGNVYLSFRENELVNGVLLADDGVVVLPRAALGYDADGDVAGVDFGVAAIVLDRARVSALVGNAGLVSASGSGIHSLGDLQGLALDPLGGTFEPVQPVPGLGDAIPHLLFCGQRLGATVLTTRDGGTIATLDGAPLGASPLSGGPLGLDPGTTDGMSDDLGALAVGPAGPARPCLDVAQPEVLPDEGDPVAFHLGGFSPERTVLVALGVLPAAPGITPDAVATQPHWGTPHLLVAPPTTVVALVVGANGRATLGLTVPVELGGPSWLVAQAFEPFTERLSEPAGIVAPWG